MTNENNSDKGFWVQMILGVAVVILIFMYIRSLSDKPAKMAAAGSAQSAQVASAEPKKDPGVALAEVVARMSSGDDAQTAKPDADAAKPAPVVEQSVVAVVEEVPAAAAVEPAPAPVEAQVVAVVEAVAEPQAAKTPVSTEAAAEAEAAPAPVQTQTEATKVAAAEEAKPSAPAETKADADAKDAATAETGENKGRDWLSKLGFGESDQAKAAEEKAEAGQPKAAAAEPAAEKAPVAAPVSPAATEQQPALAQSQPQTQPQTQPQSQPGNFDPYVVAPPMDAAPGATADVPDWARERMERVEKLRTELQESMAQMHEQARAKAMEERQRRYEEHLQAMPEWMRARVEKIDQLRKDLREESMALQKAMREHRAEAMQAAPAASEEVDADDAIPQEPEMVPEAPYYPQVMPPHYGPRGYAYPGYPYRY